MKFLICLNINSLKQQNKTENKMNKKRMSDLKSQLRLNIQDFCLTLPENSDPIVGYLLTILEWQASLDVETNSILHRSFVNQIEQLKCRLKMEMKSIKNKPESADSHSNNITKLINQFHKLKEVFACCLILSKKNSQLYKQVEKFYQYKPKEPNLTEQLQNYLNEPIIFETIFRSYLRVYNINILTADLINFLYTQHQEKNKVVGQIDKVSVKKWGNADIEHLKCQNIIFKQLKDMNKKYLELENKLKNSYIYFLCTQHSDTPDEAQTSTNINISMNQNTEQKQKSKNEQEKVLKQKIKKLEKLLMKIKNDPGLYHAQKSTNFVIESEPLYNFTTIQISNDYQHWKVLEFNKQFFLETLYGKLWTQSVIGDEQFTFLRQKILKIQSLLLLNRILSGINVISYTYNQLDLEARQNCEYEFMNLRKLIGSQFINKKVYNQKIGKKKEKNIFVSNDKNLKSMTVIDGENNKILYPSSINYFLNIIKNLLSIQFVEKQQILQVLEVQCQHIEILAQTILNIYQIIKLKHLSSYKLLRKYIEIILKSCCWNTLGAYDYSHFSHIVHTIALEKEKIGVISQIIYEFDHNYSIKQALQVLVRIQFDGLTKNCTNTLQLYRQILYEIIQIRNSLKLDHYYSINQIHETFSLIPPDLQKMQGKLNNSKSSQNSSTQSNKNIKTSKNMGNHSNNSSNRRQDLYFQDIIHEVCLASLHTLYLPKLFIFFDLQLKFKRILFKLQLCWSSANKQSIFDKKSQAFKDFLATYSTPILQIVNQSHEIVEILSKMQDLQRYINIFDNEVSRFYLVQKLVSIINCYKDKYQIHSLREHLNRLSLENLQELNSVLGIFNPIQCHKQSAKLKVIEKLQKNIKNNSSIRIGELKNYNPSLEKQKQKLSSIILIFHIIGNRGEQKDHENIIKLYKQQSVNYNLYQLKSNEVVTKKYEQLLSCQNLDELIRYYEDLLVISIFTTLRQIQSEFELESNIRKNTQNTTIEDNKHNIYNDQHSYMQLQRLMNKFELSGIFSSLSSIQEIQFWRNQLGIMTKYHQIYQLMFHFDCFNSKIYGNSIKKAQYKDSKYLNYVNHTVNFSYETPHFITILYYLFQISPLTKIKLQKNIQILQRQIIQVDSVHRKASYYHTKLKQKIYSYFCQTIQKMIDKYDIGDEIQIKFDGKKQPKEYIDLLRKKMLKDVSNEYKYDIKQEGYGQFRQIQMFREKKGYQLPIIQAKETKQYKIVTKKNPERSKKAVISPQRIEDQKKKPLMDLKRKFKIEILKSSMQIRKHISKLQLSENKIRQQIIWETSKLQHSVIEKINQFITLSNLDKQQSYIKFKHTVNLETIKGIENVIQEQTQMYMQRKNRIIDKTETFITNIEQNEEQKMNYQTRLLDANVDSILEHMKKIRIFSGWKKIMKKTDLTEKQWCNFNLNVQKILNNDKVALSLKSIDETRNNYLRQNVTCEIMKQENMRISEKIQDLKLNNLEKKVLQYRDKLLCE